MTTLRMHNAIAPQHTLRTRQVSCLNCAVTLVGDFCHHCGQAATTPAKVTFGQIVRDVPRAVWDFERALPQTILGILLRPGRIIRDFLAGRRARIYSPVALLFLLSGLLGVATSTYRVHHGANAQGDAIAETMLGYYSWLVICCIPLQAIGPTLILRRRLGLGYGEQFMAATMAAIGTTTLGLLFAPLEWYGSKHHYGWGPQVAGSAIKLFYLMWAYAQLQQDGKQEWAGWRWLRAFMIVLASGFSLVFTICCIALLVLLAGLAIAYVQKSGFALR